MGLEESLESRADLHKRLLKFLSPYSRELQVWSSLRWAMKALGSPGQMA